MKVKDAVMSYLRTRRKASVDMTSNPDGSAVWNGNSMHSVRAAGSELSIDTQITDLGGGGGSTAGSVTAKSLRSTCSSAADGVFPAVGSSTSTLKIGDAPAGSASDEAGDLKRPETGDKSAGDDFGGEDENENVARHHPPERGNWSNPIEFFLTCLGYTVGLGNIWRFPYLCYENGGGAFLIPYLIMLIFTGLPLYGLELCLGQYASLGPNKVFAKMVPLFQGLGYAVVLFSVYTAIYYNVIIAWTIFYFFASFASDVPWKYCGHDFNSMSCFSAEEESNCRGRDGNLTFWNNTCTPVDVVCRNTLNRCLREDDGDGDEAANCAQTWHDAWNSTHCVNVSAVVAGELGASNDTRLHVPLKLVFQHVSASEEYFTNYMLDQSDGWHDFGGLKWDLVLCSALAWILCAAALIKGVESSGKVVYFTALFPYAVLIVFCVKGATLPGAYNGFKFFVTPKWDLLRRPQVWVAAATQNFYSLGPAFGGLITFSSYNKFTHNSLRDAVLLGLADAGTSFFAGSVVFMIVGYMAHELDAPVGEVIKSGAGLAFIAYPDAIGKMSVSPLWGVLFFAMLMTCGFDTEFTMVETIVTAILDEKPKWRRHKGWIMVITCAIGFILGLSMCARGGIYMFTMFDYYSAGWGVLLMGIMEAIVTVYFYGYEKFIGNVREMMPKIFPLECYWKYTWKFTSPILVLAIVIATFVEYERPNYEGVPFPVGIDVLGWLMGISPLVVFFGFGIYQVLKASRNGNSFRSLLQPRPGWGPAHWRMKGGEPAQCLTSAMVLVENSGVPANENKFCELSVTKLVRSTGTESTLI